MSRPSCRTKAARRRDAAWLHAGIGRLRHRNAHERRGRGVGFLVVYPPAAPSANAQKCWNWFKASEQRRGAGEPSLIAGLALLAVAEFSADPCGVCGAGLSAGGGAAAVLGATCPDVFAAVGVHCGLACGAAADLPSAFAAMSGKGAPQTRQTQRAIPAIFFHGDADRSSIPSTPIGSPRRRARSKGCAATSSWARRWPECLSVAASRSTARTTPCLSNGTCMAPDTHGRAAVRQAPPPSPAGLMRAER